MRSESRPADTAGVRGRALRRGAEVATQAGKRWAVLVVRTLNGQVVGVYRLGPFRWKATAVAVAWLDAANGPRWRQQCSVEEWSPSWDDSLAP